MSTKDEEAVRALGGALVEAARRAAAYHHSPQPNKDGSGVLPTMQGTEKKKGSEK